jgi:hypothetical protein
MRCVGISAVLADRAAAAAHRSVITSVPRVQVWAAVHLLQMIGQKKTAHRLKYGYLAWEVRGHCIFNRYIWVLVTAILNLHKNMTQRSIPIRIRTASLLRGTGRSSVRYDIM